jgi:ABC-type sulfate transport system, permease component
MSRLSLSRLRGTGSSPELLVPTLLGGLFVCYLAVPFVAFVSRTGVSNVVAGLSTPEAQAAVRNSLLTAPVATLVATTLGVPLAYVLARRSFPGSDSSRC